jgi:sec-independent protein translocase protein TatB
MLSIPHLIVIFVVVLVVFGPEKLPELARNMGKIMAEFKRATGDLRSTFEGHMRDLEREADERRIGAAAQAAAPAPAQPPPIVPAAGTVTADAPNAAAITAGAPGAADAAGASEQLPDRATDPGITPEPVPPSMPASDNSAQLDLMPMSPPPGDPMHDPFLFEYERQSGANAPAPVAPAAVAPVSGAPAVPAAVASEPAAPAAQSGPDSERVTK